MGRPKGQYDVTREIIADFSAFDELFVNKAVKRKQLKPNDLGSICAWLAENGKPEVRSAMARRLVPVVLGCISRDQAENDRILGQNEHLDVCLSIFKIDTKKRQARAAKIKKNRPGRGTGPRSR